MAIQVKDVQFRFTASDDTGEIISGWLDLTGVLKPIRLVWNGRHSRRLEKQWMVKFDDGPEDPIACEVTLDEPLMDK